MGSFNASCAVSHCSINPGDPVKLIPIVSNTPIHGEYKADMHKGFACYCHDQFSFIGYPMDATYEDYGNFEMKEDMFSEYNLSIIRENYTRNRPPQSEDGEDEEYSSIADSRNGYSVTAENLTWEEIGEMIHFGNMYLDSNKDHTKRRYMGYFPVHKCVYDLFMKRGPEMYFDETYDNVTFARFLEKHLEDNKPKGNNPVFEEAMVQYMELFGPLIGTELKDGSIMTPEMAHEKAVGMAELKVEMANLRDSHRKEYSYNNSTDIGKFLKYRREHKLPELTDEEHLALVTLDAECTFVVRGLNDLQIPILPPMTAGQQYDKTDHATFLIAAGKALLDMQKVRDEEYNDEGEDTNACEYVVESFINISLSKLRESSASDWKPERGKLKVDAIDRFSVQYPDGVTLTADEIIEQGYGIMLASLESTILPLVFKNDIEVE